MKILFQGSLGAYSHLAALEVYPEAEIIPCKTFDECFSKANEDDKIKIIIPESNRITGNIGVEHFHPVQHHLLGLRGTKTKDIKHVYSHAQALSQSSQFIKKNNFIENVSADTAGSAKYVSENKNKNKAAIASKLSAKIYNLDVLASNIEDEKGNVTRFLLMGKPILQPELKNKPAALYSALSGFAIQGVNLTKLQSYPEKNSFTSYFFLCDLDGHIEEPKVQKSLEELGLHCEDFHVLGVFTSDKFREK